MRSEVLIVASPGRGPRFECQGAIAVRHTAADTVYLVSAAATPLGGDDIHFRVVVEHGAQLRVRSVAAAIALPGPGSTDSHAHWDLDVAGDLDMDPLPTIVAAAARHFSSTRVLLADAGRITLRERVQIGRAGEQGGFWSGALSVDVTAGPLLRHRVELGVGSPADDLLGAPRAQISTFSYPDREIPGSDTVLALQHGGFLATWQGERLPPQS